MYFIKVNKYKEKLFNLIHLKRFFIKGYKTKI